MSLACAVLSVALVGDAAGADPADAPLRVLFLGDSGPHEPALRHRVLAPVLAERGIAVDYTERADDLNERKLAGYDALIVYANIERITPEQEAALLNYVRNGGGFAPLHCASFCFQNSPAYVALVGAQFQSHGTGVFPSPPRPSTTPSWTATSASRAGMRLTSTPSIIKSAAPCWSTAAAMAAMAACASRGRGSARRDRAASSTPPPDTTCGPGNTRSFRTSSNAASAGRAGDFLNTARRRRGRRSPRRL